MINNIEEIKSDVYLSIIVPIAERYDDLSELYASYKKILDSMERKFEFIFIINGEHIEVLNELLDIKRGSPEVKIMKLNRNFGEAAALSAGFSKAHGKYILTLYPYYQVEPEGIRDVVRKLEQGVDLVITRRYPRVDSLLNRIQTFAFHWLIRKLIGISFRDISSGLRGMTRGVASELNLYGDLHRFIPILAFMRGFKVVEIDVRQSKKESSVRIYRPGVYARRFLDIFTVFFLFKFTKKPLRFFGLVGMAFFAAGSSINIVLTIQRVVEKIALADRPLLLLGVLAMVLGIQIASIGLLGEIIIYTHAREIKDYQIEKILE